MEIICYLSNGYPNLETSFEMAGEYADAGCKIIEVDFPARDPYLESEYLANRMAEALKSCDDYRQYMKSIVRIKESLPEIKLLVLAYEQTVLEIGTEEFIQFCLQNQLKDILLVGLKDNQLKDQLMESGLKVSCYIQFHLPENEVELAEQSNGFVYLQAKPYDNQPIHPEYKTLKEGIAYLRERGIVRPIYCGVGVHTALDVKMVKEAGADAAFVGSSILKLQPDILAMKQKIKEFRAEC